MNKQIIREFYHEDPAIALEACINKGYKPMFMPELTDAITEQKLSWFYNCCTQSIKATGKTKQGNKVAVYGHIPNYFSDPANLKETIAKGLVEGACIIPQEELQKLADAEDNEKVFVIDHKKLMDYKEEHKRKTNSHNIFSLNEALENPEMIAILGGEKKAEAFLKKYRKVHNRISLISYNHINQDCPLACMLSFDGGHQRQITTIYDDLKKFNNLVGIRYVSNEEYKAIQKRNIASFFLRPAKTTTN